MGVRFIRKNGRVIPIRENGKTVGVRRANLPQRGANVTLNFQTKKRSVGERFAAGATTGAVISSLGAAGAAEVGARLALNRKGLGAAVGVGALIGSGALVGGALSAAFGRRKKTVVKVTQIQKAKSGKR